LPSDPPIFKSNLNGHFCNLYVLLQFVGLGQAKATVGDYKTFYCSNLRPFRGNTIIL
jgi:hypothetical protein